MTMHEIVKRIPALMLGMALGLTITMSVDAIADWYEATGKPVARSLLSSADLRTEFASIESDISDKLPTLTGNGSKMVAVNSGASALEAVTAASGRSNLGITNTHATAELKYKASDQAETGGVLKDDDDLASYTVDSSGIYAFEGLLLWDSDYGSDGGIRLFFSLSETPVLFHANFYTVPSGGGDVTGEYFANAGAPNNLSLSPSLTYLIHVEGIMHSHASNSGTLKVQWDAYTSAVASITMKKGSWLSLTKLN